MTGVTESAVRMAEDAHVHLERLTGALYLGNEADVGQRRAHHDQLATVARATAGRPAATAVCRSHAARTGRAALTARVLPRAVRP